MFEKGFLQNVRHNRTP